MADEWGPWIEHDGKGCPVKVGTWARGVNRAGTDEVWRVGYFGGIAFWDESYNAWLWVSEDRPGDILRYRIRKPRALLELIDLVENLPAPHRERETA